MLLPNAEEKLAAWRPVALAHAARDGQPHSDVIRHLPAVGVAKAAAAALRTKFPLPGRIATPSSLVLLLLPVHLPSAVTLGEYTF